MSFTYHQAYIDPTTFKVAKSYYSCDECGFEIEYNEMKDIDATLELHRIADYLERLTQELTSFARDTVRVK